MMQTTFSLKKRILKHYALNRVLTNFPKISPKDFEKKDIYKCPFFHDPPDFFSRIFSEYDITLSSHMKLFSSTL